MSRMVIRPASSPLPLTSSSFSTLCSWRMPLACSRVVSAGPGDQVGLGHDRADRDVVVLEELQVAAGQDADQLLALDDGDAGDVLLLHELRARLTGSVGRERDRVEDHAVLGPFDLGDLPPLGLDGEVLVDDADAAFLGQGNGQGGLRDRIHGRRDDRDIDRDIAGQVGARIRLAGHEIALARDEQDIIKGNPFGDNLAMVHPSLLKP